MATQMIPTESQNAQAAVLLARADKWAQGTRADGLRFYLFASSRTLSDGTPILNMTRADGQGCSCKSWLYRNLCSHAIAVRMFNERHARTVEAAQARYQQQATVTTWRKCARSWCEALVAPESLSRFCDHCAEKNRRLLAAAFGEE